MVGEPTLFVVDDDALVRESILESARSEGLAGQGFASAEEFLAAFDPARAGCLILDLRLPGMSGLALLQNLRTIAAALPVIVVTGFGNVPSAVQAMKEGAVDFLEKPINLEDLMRAVHEAIHTDQQKRKQQNLAESAGQKIAALSEDERKVYRLLLAGQPNKQIAATLGIGLRTVELRRATLLKKMDAASLPELVRLAILGGLTSDSPS